MTEKMSADFIKANMMGPNAVKLLEEAAASLPFKPGSRVLDLGCGKGLTSIYLASTFSVRVFAMDLWIPAAENFRRFRDFGLDDAIVPIHADIAQPPFAEGYFDTVVSVDAYHYFGRDPAFMDARLAPLVKQDGMMLLVFPGLKREVGRDIPPEMLLSWRPEDIDTMHSPSWWSALLAQAVSIDVVAIKEAACSEEAWEDWLACDNPYAVGDRRAMCAGAGKHMNFISVLCRKR
ncbi:MAG: SAM-dependent methyltransferase [Alphaproteobacteria bacterium]